MTTIKINREQLIVTLTAKIKELEANNVLHDKQDKAWRAAITKWEQECAAIALKNIKKASISVNTWRSENSVNISLPAGILPAQPEQEFTVPHTAEYELRDLRQFVRMLELSDADTINMSALKNVSQYL